MVESQNWHRIVFLFLLLSISLGKSVSSVIFYFTAIDMPRTQFNTLSFGLETQNSCPPSLSLIQTILLIAKYLNDFQFSSKIYEIVLLIEVQWQ